jgi:hypothetical protein
MIIKRAIAVESLTKVCEESLNLIKQLIDADHAVYGKGFEDGMAAQAKIQQTLRPWVDLTDEEIMQVMEIGLGVRDSIDTALEKLKTKNATS